MKYNSWKKIIQRISILCLLITVLLQIITVIIIEFTSDHEEIEEIHELIGYIFVGLVLIHVLFFWNSVKRLLSSAKP